MYITMSIILKSMWQYHYIEDEKLYIYMEPNLKCNKSVEDILIGVTEDCGLWSVCRESFTGD